MSSHSKTPSNAPVKAAANPAVSPPKHPETHVKQNSADAHAGDKKHETAAHPAPKPVSEHDHPKK